MILGKYEKQPAEIEIYGIQFAGDMGASDEISAAWTAITPKSFAGWDRVTQTAPYSATLADDKRLLVVTASVTLPAGAPDGYRLPVANYSQVSAVSVGGVNVPARCSVLVARKAGAWVVEAKTDTILVDAPGDQRVRTRVTGGTNLETYEIQVTAETAEGRVLQNEFLVKVKEV